MVGKWARCHPPAPRRRGRDGGWPAVSGRRWRAAHRPLADLRGPLARSSRLCDCVSNTLHRSETGHGPHRIAGRDLPPRAQGDRRGQPRPVRRHDALPGVDGARPPQAHDQRRGRPRRGGRRSPPERFELAADPADQFDAAATTALAAWRTPGVLDRVIDAGPRPMPGRCWPASTCSTPRPTRGTWPWRPASLRPFRTASPSLR